MAGKGYVSLNGRRTPNYRLGSWELDVGVRVLVYDFFVAVSLPPPADRSIVFPFTLPV